MTPYTRNMNQTATYWEPNVNDGFGGRTFLPPIVIRCRWQDKVDLVRSPNGQEVPSSSVVYPDRGLLPKGYLALGDLMGLVDSDGFLDPLEVPSASQIINVGQSPSLNASQVLHKVWL